MKRRIRNLFFLSLLCLAAIDPFAAHAGRLDTWKWRSTVPAGSNYLFSIAHDGIATFVTVGNNDSGGAILTSPDANTWTARTSGTQQLLFGVAFGNATFVAVG